MFKIDHTTCLHGRHRSPLGDKLPASKLTLISIACAALAWSLAATPAAAQGGLTFSDPTCVINPGAVINNGAATGGLAVSGASDCPPGTTPSATVGDAHGIAIGSDRTRPTTTAGDGDSIALGSGAAAGTEGVAGAIAVGGGTIASGHQSVAIGRGADALGANSVAIGADSRSDNANDVSLGALSHAAGGDALALGGLASANGLGSTALGAFAFASNSTATALGSSSFATGVSSIAVGVGARSTGFDSLAMGAGAQASNSGAIVIGAGSLADGEQSISLGALNVVSGVNSGAFGNGNLIDAPNAFVLGNNVTIAAALNGAVALGNGTIVAAPVGTSGILINGVNYAFAGATPQSTVSIGSAASPRTLTNLAAGRVNGSSTDAVNGSQLFAVSQAIEAIDGTVADAVLYDDPSAAIVTFAGVSGTRLTNVAPGVLSASSTDAVNGTQLFATNEALGILDTDVQQLYDFSVFYDDTTLDVLTFEGASGTLLTNLAAGEVSANSTDAVTGAQLFATNEAVVELDSVLTDVIDFSVFYDDTTTFGSITLQGLDGTLITNLAPGALSATSTDAVNGSQLFATNEELGILDGIVEQLDALAVQYDDDSQANITLGGVSGTTITNLAPGALSAASTDATNGSQLFNTASSTATALGGGAALNPNGSITSPTYAVQGGSFNNVGSALGAIDTQVTSNTTAIANLSSGGTGFIMSTGAAAPSVSGPNAAAGGPGALASADGALALGASSRATNQGSIAIGSSALSDGVSSLAIGVGSRASGQQSVSVGASNAVSGGGAFGRLNLVTGGSSFAIGANNQIIANNAFVLGNNVTIGGTLTGGPVALGNGTIVAAPVATSGIVLNGVNYVFAGATPVSTVSIGSAASPRTLTNLAAGRVSGSSTDAINGSQLFATNQAIGALDGEVNQLNALAVLYNDATLSAITFGGAAGTRLTNVTPGVLSASSTDAINGSQLFNTASSTATALGGGATLNPNGSITAPTYAVQGGSFNNVGSALGAIDTQVTTNTTAIAGLTTDVGALDALAVLYGDDTQSSIALGGAAGTTITNVAPGALSATSTEAVNGSQLFATNEALDLLGGDVDQLNTLAVLYDSDTFGVLTFDGSGGTRLTNVAPGALSASSTDAVNGAQLFTTNEALDVLNGNVDLLSALAVLYDDDTLSNITLGGASGTVLSNLAAGEISDTSTDAINGAQLNTAVLDLEDQIDAAGNGFVTSDGSVAPSASGVDSAAGGSGAFASGDRAVALGANAEAAGPSSIAIGDSTQASGAQSIAIGAGNLVSGANSGAFGDPNVVTGAGSYAFGNDNTIDADNAFVLGNNVTIAIGLDGAIALGNGTTVAAAIATPSIVLNNTTYAFAGAAPSSTVSIGAAGQERTLTNLAAGQISATSTDAINGSQLFATNQALEALAAGVGAPGDLAVLYDDPGQASVTLGGASGTTITNVAAGATNATSTDAVNGTQLFFVASKVAEALGGGAVPNPSDSVTPFALPTYIIQGETHDNVGSALGALDTQVTQNTAALASIASDIESGGVGLVQQAAPGADLTVGAETDGARVDFNGTAGPRVLTGVGAGAVNAGSTDAVNGGQLDEAITTLEQQINAVGPGAFVSDPDDPGEQPIATGAGASAGGVNAVASGEASLAVGNGAQASGAQSVAIGAGSTDDGADNVVSVGATNSERRVVHVASGVDETDAVNVGQLNTAFDRAVSSAYAYTDERFAAVGADMNVLRRDSEAGTAAAMALTGIPQSYRAGTSMFGVGVGSWQGESAIAFGASRSTSDGRVVLRAGGTYNSRSQGGVSAGVGVSF